MLFRAPLPLAGSPRCRLRDLLCGRDGSSDLTDYPHTEQEAAYGPVREDDRAIDRGSGTLAAETAADWWIWPSTPDSFLRIFVTLSRRRALQIDSDWFIDRNSQPSCAECASAFHIGAVVFIGRMARNVVSCMWSAVVDSWRSCLLLIPKLVKRLMEFTGRSSLTPALTRGVIHTWERSLQIRL